MVNHFLLDNEKLIDRLVSVVEESISINTNENNEYVDHEFTYSKHREFHEIKNELLNRMKLMRGCIKCQLYIN